MAPAEEETQILGEGASLISAEIVADTVCPVGNRITTMSVRIPMTRWAEVLTHRAFSRSAKSTRAVPFRLMLEQVRNDPATPNHWGAEQKGMQAGAALGDTVSGEAEDTWLWAAKDAAGHAQGLHELGLHKSTCTELLWPFLYTEAVITATEWLNFFALRCSPEAHSYVHELAWKMFDALQASSPTQRTWHLPFVSDQEQEQHGIACHGEYDALPWLMYASAMRCARVSYGHVDGRPSTVVEDSVAAHSKLALHGHLSPFEHAAMATGVGRHWHANFRGWKSARQEYLLEGAPIWDSEVAEASGWRHAYKKE